MNSLAWIGVIVWGAMLTLGGLLAAGAPAANPALQAQDVLFLVGGGLFTVLIGATGLMGFMGWVPGLRRAHA